MDERAQFSEYTRKTDTPLKGGHFLFSRLEHGHDSVQGWSLFRFPSGLVTTGPAWSEAMRIIERRHRRYYWSEDRPFLSEMDGLSVFAELEREIIKNNDPHIFWQFDLVEDPFEDLMDL